jgi:6-phosphofructokinase 2
MEPILTITLNPSLDLTTSVEQLMAHQKLRCDPPRYDPGGGGINVSRAINELGGQSCAYVALAGETGRHLYGLLEDTGISVERRELRGETRSTFQVMENSTGKQYRFVLPGPDQTAELGETLLDDLVKYVRTTKFSFVVASGSLPPGFAEDFYAKLVARMREMDVKIIVDTSGAALKAVLAARPFLIKPDRYEAQSLLGLTRDGSMSADDLVEHLINQQAAEVAIVTLGSEGAVIATADMKLHIRPPKVEVRSAVGAGDSFIGALTLALASGWSLEDSAQYAVAAAASAVTTEASALCRRSQTDNFLKQIRDSTASAR